MLMARRTQEGDTSMTGTERGAFSEIPQLDVSSLYGSDEAAIERVGSAAAGEPDKVSVQPL